MTTKMIDGRAIAADLRRLITKHCGDLARRGVTPGLAVVLVGDDPASRVYVRNKGARAVETGMRSFEHRLPKETSQDELLNLIAALNARADVDGILVQLPLPPQINAKRIIEAIDPAKDVDGFHPVNSGLLATTGGGVVPCTPLGSLILIKSVRSDIAGLEAVVIGRSNIVGKPMAQLLLSESCTVTVAHSKTRDLQTICRRADIVVAAVGRPEMVRGDWIKPGAIVIDVGINRAPNLTSADGNSRLVGDIAFADATGVAGALTPVPGGVGPMTIACLLANTVAAACQRRGIPAPTVTSNLDHRAFQWTS